jgi:hypothetical protein
MSLLSTLNWGVINGILLDNSTDSSFLPVSDLTNGIHLLRTLCPDDPPEADELLDYFDSTYISGRLRQQKPAQNQAVRLVLRRRPHIVNCPLSTNVGD